MSNTDAGNKGEEIACQYLKKLGFKILERNYRIRGGEIDIVAKDKDALVFVEVKARHSTLFGSPGEAISAHKQRQISKSAICYLKENNLLKQPARFDVVTLLYKEDLPEIDLIKDAFELSPGFTV